MLLLGFILYYHINILLKTYLFNTVILGNFFKICFRPPNYFCQKMDGVLYLLYVCACHNTQFYLTRCLFMELITRIFVSY